jgi:hypothetical protein
LVVFSTLQYWSQLQPVAGVISLCLQVSTV